MVFWMIFVCYILHKCNEVD